MKEQIKKILMETIYTRDAKPRFIGGDLDTKLKYIDEAVDKLEALYDEESRLLRARHILSESDTLTIEEQIAAIEAQADIDGFAFIDDVEGVLVWQKLEWELTCDDFLEQIS